MMRVLPICTCIVALIVAGSSGRSQEWTRFRGPKGQGIGRDGQIPTSWTEADYNWKKALPGAGHSSPVLWADRVFVGSADDESGDLLLLCLAVEDGSILWKLSFPLERFAMHSYNTFASGSPAVDAKRVYYAAVSPSKYRVVAADHDGKKIWERDLGPFASQHGPASSPVVYQDKVILSNEQDRESFLVALDSATGEILWKQPRKTVEAAYGTPCVYQPPQGQEVLIFSSEAHGISAINPQSGAVVWEYPKAFDKRVVSSPVVAGDLILGTCGSGGGGNYLVALRPPEPGKRKEPEVAWTIRRSAPYVPTSVYYNGRVYLWNDGGIVSCVDASTGEMKYQERAGGNYFSSPVIVGDRIFGVSTRGEVIVVATGDTFKVLARNPLGETMHSTPAVAGGRIYFRTLRHLISLGGRRN